MASRLLRKLTLNYFTLPVPQNKTAERGNKVLNCYKKTTKFDLFNHHNGFGVFGALGLGLIVNSPSYRLPFGRIQFQSWLPWTQVSEGGDYKFRFSQVIGNYRKSLLNSLEQFKTFGQSLSPQLNQKPVTLISLLLSSPLTALLTQVSCEEYKCDCACKKSCNGGPQLSCTCKKPAPPCAETCEKPCCKTKNKNGLTPVRWDESQELSHCVLVRQASQLVIDSVTRLLTQTLSAYSDYHSKYRCLIDTLLDALEDSRTAQGTHLEIIDCKLIMLRADLERMKCSIAELEAFMCSIQRLADAAAETAFLAHAEYCSIAMSERVQSVANEMKRIKEETLRKERDMIELQSVVIVESGRSLK